MMSDQQARFNYHSADWYNYRTIIDCCIVSDTLHTPQDIEFAIVYIANLIQFARRESVPIYQSNDKAKLHLALKGDSFWKKLLRKLRSGNVTLQNVKDLIQCCSNSPFDQVKCKHNPVNNCDQKMACHFAETFQRAQETTLTWSHPNYELVTKCLSSSFYIKCQDIKNVVHSLKPTKSAGPDQIENILIKNLPPSAIERLTEIFNACILLCYWPSYFQSAKVVPILKSGKDPADTSSYRPIRLVKFSKSC